MHELETWRRKEMNKKQIRKIKNIIGFDSSSNEHKRLLRRLKRQYSALPSAKRPELIEDLRKAFKVD